LKEKILKVKAQMQKLAEIVEKQMRAAPDGQIRSLIPMLAQWRRAAEAQEWWDTTFGRRWILNTT